MKCREAMELFSPYLDGELTAAEGAALEAHLKMCVTCREEMETLCMISGVLGAEADTVSAPPGFSGGVMRAIGKQHRGPWYGRLPGLWKQAVAVAAALALIAAGSLQMGLGQLLMRGGPQVAENPPGSQVATPEPGPADQGMTPKVEQPGDPGDPVAPDNPKSEEETPGTEVKAGNTPDKKETPAEKPTPAKPNVRPAGTATMANTYEARVFLSKQRAIRSTLLKVQVDNVRSALDQTLRLGGTYGAQFQMTERISNGEIEVVRLTVGREQADVLTGKLGALGRVITRDSTVQDITGQFDRTREQYQGLLAKLNTVPAGAERTEMETTLRSLESQLADWDREAERYVIVLWLQP